MLETEIQKLIDHVAKLTVAIEAQTALFTRFEQISKEAGRKSLADSAAKWEAEGLTVPDDIKAKIAGEDKPAVESEATPKAEKPKPAAKKTVDAPVDKPVDEPEGTPDINRDDLQAKCMTIVRADRSKRKAIEELIASFGGTLIRDVPEDKLVELSAKLDELA